MGIVPLAHVVEVSPLVRVRVRLGVVLVELRVAAEEEEQEGLEGVVVAVEVEEEGVVVGVVDVKNVWRPFISGFGGQYKGNSHDRG